MAFLDRDLIFGKCDLQSKQMNIPEWGGTIVIRELTGVGREKIEAAVAAATKAGQSAPPHFREMLVVMSVVDAEGAPIFREADVELLSKKSSIVLSRIADEILKLNKLSAPIQDDVRKN